MSDSTAEADVTFMRRALRLAMNGRGSVEPNPMVGCVIVKNGRVIGEGYHQRYREAHAEPNALAACTESPEGATAYVTLEPCCHTNKQTPPCAPRLIAAKIARVVVGCLDPNPDVNGKGMAMLRASGIETAGSSLEAEARQLIAPFVARVRAARPYITLKWAETADGKIAGPGGVRRQISNARSSRVVHQLRSRSDGILVGINTVIVDDPMLVARDVESTRRLNRIVLDNNLLLPLTSKLVQTASGDVIVICSAETLRNNRDRVDALRAAGVEVATAPADDPQGSVSLWFATRIWDPNPMTHLLVEPGPTLARCFFAENLIDRLWVFRSAASMNDATAPAGARVSSNYIVSGECVLDSDRLTEYLNPNSDVYFGPFPSADFVLANA